VCVVCVCGVCLWCVCVCVCVCVWGWCSLLWNVCSLHRRSAHRRDVVVDASHQSNIVRSFVNPSSRCSVTYCVLSALCRTKEMQCKYQIPITALLGVTDCCIKVTRCNWLWWTRSTPNYTHTHTHIYIYIYITYVFFILLLLIML